MRVSGPTTYRRIERKPRRELFGRLSLSYLDGVVIPLSAKAISGPMDVDLFKYLLGSDFHMESFKKVKGYDPE